MKTINCYHKRCGKLASLLLLCLFALMPTGKAQAQKFALVDMEYVLKNIPAYERANDAFEKLAHVQYLEFATKVQ